MLDLNKDEASGFPPLIHQGNAPAPVPPVAVADYVHPPSPLNKQVGGDHYKKLKIQPMEYSMANNLDACQHTAIKYITRFRDKGGVADLDKAIHCIEMLKEFEGRKSE